ncbi:MAG: hypothetical protein JWL88_711 [Parcubacteria group bacterium]|nr:hypothetical protein [Parcubacteria group bacterium]
MKLTILGIIVAVVLSAGASYATIHPGAQTAAAGASFSAHASSLLFDTSRVIDLLKQLLSIRNAATPSLPTPVATTSPAKPAARTATTTASAASASAKQSPPNTRPAAPTAPDQSPTEHALGLVLPKLRSSLVNIVCLPKAAGTLHGVSGSGIIINPNGVILTVAHVAQYALLAEARPDLMSCFVRTGSPANFAYKEKPIYVSRTWITKNEQTISSADPRGTGENDFALLVITSSDTGAPLPSSFAYVPIFGGSSVIGDPVVIGSYGAEFLTSARIRSDLFPTLVFGTIHDRYTFNTSTIDLISLGGGAAAQQGSSGGGIVNQAGQLVGLITTSSSGTDLATRDLHAITASYLLRAFKQEQGTDINSYITSTDAATLVSNYATEGMRMANLLLAANSIK